MKMIRHVNLRMFMKKITLALLILAPFLSETNARPGRGNSAPFREICSELNAAMSTGTTEEFCNGIATRFQGLPSFANSLCIDAAAKFSDDPDNGPTYCHTQFRDLRTATQAELLMPSFNQVVELPQPKMRQSQVAQDCDNQFMCTFNSELLLPEYQNLMRRLNFYAPPVPVTSLNLSPTKCACLESSVQESGEALGIQDIERSLSQERKRINGLIFNAVGKKLINDFASNLEDLNFFNTNNVQAIGGDSGRAHVTCNEFSNFQAAVMDKCRRNGVEASVGTQRMTSLMNAFGDLGKNSDAQTLFSRLTNDIMNYQVDPSQVFPGRRGTFTRQEYDRFRFGVYKSQPEVGFVNDILDLLMDDEVLGPEIIRDIQSGKRPGHAISLVLRDKKNERTRNILKRYLRRNNRTTFHQNLKAALEANAPEAYSNYLLETFNVATDMHPGLKALLKDKDLFFSTREKMHTTGSHSLLETMDSTPDSLVNYFRERCNNLKREFAEAACVPNEDYISRADRSDLAELLSTVQDLNQPLSEILLCRMPTDQPARSIFTRLAIKPHDRINQADYFLMKVSPKNASASRFGQVAMRFASGDEKTFRALNAISASGDAFRRPSAEVAAQLGETQKTPVTQETTITALNDLIKRSQDQEKPAQEPQPTNYLAPVPVPTRVAEESKRQESNPRNLLKDFLANKNNEEEVERLLSNTSKEDHEELVRLRREVQESRDRMKQLLEETERNKLDNLRAEYERLEREVNNDPAPERKPASQEEVSETEVRSTSVIAPVQSTVRLPDAGGVSSGGTTSTSAGGTSGNGGGVARSIATDESVITASLPAGQAIVIESAKIQGNSPEGRAQISEEVIAYLQNSSPDLNTLKQLKESGIIIKYKVIEDGEEVQKEMRVSYSDLSPEARQVVDRKLQTEERLVALERAKRAYSYSALRHLLGIRVQSEQE